MKLAVVEPLGRLKTFEVLAGIASSKAAVEAVAFHLRRIVLSIAVTSILVVAAFKVMAVEEEIVASYVDTAIIKLYHKD